VRPRIVGCVPHRRSVNTRATRVNLNRGVGPQPQGSYGDVPDTRRTGRSVDALALPIAAPQAAQKGPAPYCTTHLTSSDIEEQAAGLRKWDQVYEQLTPGRFVGTLHEASFRGVQVFRESTNQAVHELGLGSPGARAIGVPVHMDGHALFLGEVVDASTMVTFGSADELDFYAPKSFDILGLTVDERVLDAFAQQIEHRDAMTIFGAKRVFKPNPARLDEFRRLLLSILQSLDANPSALQYHHTQRLLEQSVLAALFAVVGESDEAPPPKARCASRSHIVDQAKAFMAAHIDAPITVADLCVQLGVSRRTLQYSFQEVLGLNPVRFLRAMRLNGVRRDLRQAKPPGDAVQDLAAKWGFWHLGHFVTDYKQMFGELPSTTLRSR
jgi:AraC family transcriptional regulator, ethanolamine operon transcriptional activator